MLRMEKQFMHILLQKKRFSLIRQPKISHFKIISIHIVFSVIWQF